MGVPFRKIWKLIVELIIAGRREGLWNVSPLELGTPKQTLEQMGLVGATATLVRRWAPPLAVLTLAGQEIDPATIGQQVELWIAAIGAVWKVSKELWVSVRPLWVRLREILG